MKRFQVTAIWQQPGESIEAVDEEAFNRLGHGELEDDILDGRITELRVDAAEIPRSAGGVHNVPPTHVFPEDVEEHGGLLPPAGVVHPWDQDSWIFPVDHPLATLERVAYRQADNVRLTEPEVAKKIRQSMLAIGEIAEVNHED